MSPHVTPITPITPITPNTLRTSVEGVLPPMPGTPVELHRNGDWNNGWVVSDASDLHAVRVAKLGSPNVTVGSLRWELDVRPCQSSPFGAPPLWDVGKVPDAPTPVESDPFDF